MKESGRRWESIWKGKEGSDLAVRNKGRRLDKYVRDYVVFDLETTGINPQQDSIIEISAVKVAEGIIAAEYSTLVNPGRHIPAPATAVNGITDKMVADAPAIGEAIGGFWDFIGNSILVGHNIHTFDMNFAYDAALGALGRELANDYIDTLYMARHCLPELGHYKLTDISEYFHISTDGAHRALNDCIMNQKCYEEMGKIWKEQGANPEGNCPVCGGMLCLRKGKYGKFYGCGNFPSCRFTKKA